MSNIKIKNHLFKNPIMNASGCWCTTEKELLELANSNSSAVVSKSCTPSYRYGNQHLHTLNITHARHNAGTSYSLVP